MEIECETCGVLGIESDRYSGTEQRNMHKNTQNTKAKAFSLGLVNLFTDTNTPKYACKRQN